MTIADEQEISLLQQELTECREILLDVTNQCCSLDTGELDSMALSSYADALRYLAKHGLVEIKKDHGKRVIAVLVEKTNCTAVQCTGAENAKMD